MGRRIFAGLATDTPNLKSDLGFRNSLPVVLALSAGVCALYWPALDFGFLTDDFILLAQLQQRGIPWFSSWLSDSGFFRPMTSLSLALDLGFNATSPLGYHVTNLLLHLFVVVALYSISFLLLRSNNRSTTRRANVFAALLAFWFAVHPANGIDVVWISGRTDLLACLFILVSWGFHLRWKANRARLLFVLSSISFVLALGCKEVAVTIPTVVLLGDYVHERSKNIPPMESLVSSFKETSHLWLIAAVYLGIRLVVLDETPAMLAFQGRYIIDLLILSAKSVVLVISPLDPLTAYTFLRGVPIPIIAVASLAVGIVGFKVLQSLAIVHPRFSEFLGVVIFGILAVSSLHIASGIVTQRLMYVPIACVCVLVSAVVANVNVRHNWQCKLRFIVVAGGVPLIICAALTQRELSVWERVAKAENSATDDLANQVRRITAPIVIALYPGRVLQMGMYWAFDYRLHFALTGRFGRLTNIRTGIGIVGLDPETIGQSIRLDPKDLRSMTWEVVSENESEYLFTDQSQRAPNAIDLIEREGTQRTNLLLASTPLRLNAATRPVHYRITILDTLAWDGGAIFVWRSGKFERLR